ncbi:MAG: hypothetical protein D6739_05525, partial [Nitrospirae bacterium]
LLERFAGVRPRYATGPPPEAAAPHLVIGDAALAEAERLPPGCTAVDLAAWWHRETGLPMVFALWLLRAEVAEGEPEAAATLLRRLAAAREAGLADLEGLAARHADAAWPAPRLAAYWRRLTYRLGEAERAGLARFFALAAEVGAAPPAAAEAAARAVAP